VIAIIDDGGSFTYNIVQLVGTLGAEPVVLSADGACLAALEALRPRGIIMASAVGTPDGAGAGAAVVGRWAERAVLLGVGSGLRCVASSFGARFVRSVSPMHGKASAVIHDGTGLLEGVPSPFRAIRYDSFVADPSTLPACLRVTARAEDTGEIMALRHVSLSVEAVQFHPESAFTEHGRRIMENFVTATGAVRDTGRVNR